MVTQKNEQVFHGIWKWIEFGIPVVKAADKDDDTPRHQLHYIDPPIPKVRQHAHSVIVYEHAAVESQVILQ